MTQRSERWYEDSAIADAFTPIVVGYLERLQATNEALQAGGRPPRAVALAAPIPWQMYCWACDAAFETTNPRQQNCDKCIAHYAPKRVICNDDGCEFYGGDVCCNDEEWPVEDTDAIVGPLRIDHQRLEEWYQGQEDIPY